jgi:hypothetical protein
MRGLAHCVVSGSSAAGSSGDPFLQRPEHVPVRVEPVSREALVGGIVKRRRPSNSASDALKGQPNTAQGNALGQKHTTPEEEPCKGGLDR